MENTMADIKEIRKAICANHGGLEDATDEQIMIVWNALTAETQKKYLEKKVMVFDALSR
jgi:hypothetical protein